MVAKKHDTKCLLSVAPENIIKGMFSGGGRRTCSGLHSHKGLERLAESLLDVKEIIAETFPAEPT